MLLSKENNRFVPYFILAVGILIIWLGIQDYNFGRIYNDPISMRIFLGTSSIIIFIASFFNNVIKRNLNQIFVTLYFITVAWIYYLNFTNDFPDRFVNSLVVATLINIFIFGERRYLMYYLIGNTLFLIGLYFFIDKPHLSIFNPFVIFSFYSFAIISLNMIKVKNDLRNKNRELEAAKNELETLALATSESTDSVALCDKDFMVVYSNPIYDKLMKIEYPNGSDCFFDRLKESILEKISIEELVEQIEESEGFYEFNLRLNIDESIKWRHIRFKKVNSRNDIRYIITERDITQIKTYQDELELAVGRVGEQNTELESSLVEYEKALISIKESDKILAANKEQLTAILNANPDLIFIQDLKGDYLDAFTQNEEAFLIPKEQFLGKSMFDVLPESFLNILKPAFEKALDTEEMQVLNYNLELQNGSKKYFEARIQKYNSDKVLTITRDVTEQEELKKELIMQKDFVENITKASPNLITVFNPEANKYEFININPKEFLGYSTIELEGLNNPLLEVVHRDDIERFESSINKMLYNENISTKRLEYRVIGKNKTEKWIRTSFSLLKEGLENQEVLLLGISEDITNQVLEEEKLKKIEQSWKLALESSGDGVWDWNLETNTVIYSARWKAIIGYEDHEIENDFSEWERLVHPEDKLKALDAIDKYISGELETYNIEFRMKTKSGQWKWILARGKVIETDNDGNPLRMIGTHVDIDSRKKNQEETKSANLRFQKLIESINGIFWVKDITNNKVLYISPNYEDIWGRRVSDILDNAEDFVKPIHPDDIDSVFIAYKKIFEGEDFNEEYRIIVNDEIRWVNARTQLFKDENGTLFDYGYAEDITQRKMYEVEIIKRSNELTLAQKMAKIGGWTVDLVHNKLNWSDEVKKIHEVPENYIPTLDDGISFYIPEHQEIIKSCVQKGIETGEPFDVELKIKTYNNNIKWVRAIGEPEYDAEGKPNKLFGTFQDIDENKRTQEEKNKIFDLSIDMICVVDFNANFKQLNYSWIKTTGWSEQQLKTSSVLDFIHPDDLESSKKAISKLSNGELVISFENRFKNSKGEYQWLSWNAIPSKDVNLIYAISRDITEEKTRNEELLKAKNIAESANRAKSTFLANMSHEIRTPMNSILGFGNLLKDSLRDSEHKAYVSSIIKSGKSLLTLIDDILDLSKIEAGKMTINKEYINVIELLIEVKNIFALKASEKQIALIFEYSNISNYYETDEVRLRQILLNLIGNAIKFTEKGYVKIKLEEIKKGNDLCDLKIDVIDTGIGIPENQQKKIFESFTQQDNQSTRKYGGTGLGLTITIKLVEILGGKLELQSKDKEGSIFSISLYNLKVLNVGETEAPDQPKTKNNIGRILVAEDIESNYVVLKSLLKNGFKFEVDWARSGEQVLDYLKENSYNIIFMDIQMPDLNGIDTVKKIKSTHKLTDAKIIATTALAMKEFRDKYENYFDDYLTKPLLYQNLIDVVNKYKLDNNIKQPNQNWLLNKKDILVLKEYLDDFEKIKSIFEYDFAIELFNKIQTEHADNIRIKKWVSKLIKHANSFDVNSIANEINKISN